MPHVRDKITPGTSALFILSSDAVVDKIYDAPAGQEAPDSITIGLSPAQEAALRDVFGKDKISGAPAWIA
jgi:uncharacterized membrane protein